MFGLRLQSRVREQFYMAELLHAERFYFVPRDITYAYTTFLIFVFMAELLHVERVVGFCVWQNVCMHDVSQIFI